MLSCPVLRPAQTPGGETGETEETGSAALAILIDTAATERVLVIGRLPPAGRDLDVLVRAPTEEPIRGALLKSGYIEHADQWARFHSATVDSLNYARASTWNLPAAELDALFDEGVPVAGFEHLARPAGHHALLILARQVVLGRGRVRDKHRHRVDAVLADDPGAWDTAAARSSLWRAERALAGLREAYERGVTLPAQVRAPAIADWLQAGGRHPARARLRAWRIATKRRPRGRVITFSGLDGAGKSTQAAALARTLERLGFEVALEWTRLGPTTLTRPIFGILSWPLRRVLRMHGQRGAAAERPRVGRVVAAEDPAILAQTRALRERSGFLTAIWIALVAVAHASAQRRATRPHVRAGRLVV